MLITKSKFLIGLQCPRCFWKSMHENITNKLSLQGEQIIKQGIEINDLAKNLFNNAMDLSNMEFNSNIEATKDCLFLNHVIFKAGLKVDDLYTHIDILVPNTDESYDIVEVKIGTKVENEHIHDVAFQKYVCEKAGISINKCHILHLNSSYKKEGEINLNELFVKEDITDKVHEFYPRIAHVIEELINIYNLPQAPVVNANKYLLKEYPCKFDSECWSSFLPVDNASKLYKIRKSKVAQLFRKNIFKMSEVPDDMLNDSQLIQKIATADNEVHKNKYGIKNFIDKLQYPLYYLDFETFMEPIPQFSSCKVYAQIPFQYSLHIQSENGTLGHYEFLHKDATDPRKLILISMLNVLGDKGDIVVFNQAFEKTRLKELAELYPEYKASINRILERVIDLLVPFSKFYYYNPIQQGSCSIKKVLPAVTGKSYDKMNINNGMDASILYFKATFENRFSSVEKQQIYDDLLEYCKLDTEGMVWIVDELKKMIE